MSKKSSQYGFAPIIVVLVLGAVFAAGVGYYLKASPSNPLSFLSVKPTPALTPAGDETTPSPTENGTPTPTSSAKGNKTTPTPTIRASTPTPTPSPTPTPKRNTCTVNVIYGRLGGGSNDPLLVTLTYSYSGYNSSYMTGAQWDFDGNGSWDTDLKQSNGTMEHTYSSGTYHPRLQLQGSDGAMTDVCTGNVIVDGMDVSLSGKVYTDSNCNHSLDSGEGGISGGPITIMDANGNVYKTTTTDGDGNFSFSTNIATSASLTLLVSYDGHDNYSPYTPSATTLSASRRTGIINIPFISYDKYMGGSCN
ncbi:MAG: hypothetical protein HYW33_03535 [Candidatus Blackburnbacteria bacterium]|nr:hypothetical protein [Candidatus Blackburnbacteria bacterium]